MLRHGRLRGPAARQRGSFAGAMFGLLLVAATAALQFWNEGRSLQQQRLLDAARRTLVEAGSDRLHAHSDGRLLFVQGELRADQLLLDPHFDQPAEALALRRRVEMYQWHERRAPRGGEQAAAAQAEYAADWFDRPVDHRRFRMPAGHENPTEFPIAAATWRAAAARVGELPVGSAVIAELDGWKPMAAQFDRLPPNLAVSFRSDGRWLTSSDDPSAPQVGDLRVGFERLPAGPVSLIAAQRDGQLQPWIHDGRELLLVTRGQHSAQALLDAASSHNIGIAWLIRLGGFALMWLGFALLLAPLTALATRLPLPAQASRWAGQVLSGVLAAGLSFIAISSGFLFHRPWLLFGPLLLLGAVIVLQRRRVSMAAPAAPATDPSPLPPPPPIP